MKKILLDWIQIFDAIINKLSFTLFYLLSFR